MAVRDTQQAEDWERTWHVFADVMETTGSLREQRLEEACTGNAALRRAVEELLVAHERSDPLLDEPWAAAGAAGLTGGLNEELAELEQGAFEVAPGDLLAGRFEVQRVLGRGGMSVVVAAFDRQLGVAVAVKLLVEQHADQAAARFRREVQLARSVVHPNACRVFEHFEHELADPDSGAPTGETVPFLTMELLDGETLSQRLDRTGRLAPADALDLLEPLTEALAAAHRAGVVHRDLKASNVILVDGPDGERPVITDFGIALPLAVGESERIELTRPGEVVGSPISIAPEQLTGGAVGPAADVYALGVLAFQLVTGELPFRGATAFETAALRLHEAPPSPKDRVPELDERLAQAILALMARDPAERPRTAPEAFRLLRGERRPWAWPAGLASAAVVLGLAAWLGVSSGGRDVPGAGLVSVPRLLVIPLEVDGEGVPLASVDAFSDELRRELARSTGLDVLDWSSSRLAAQAEESPLDVGRRAGADFIVAGSVSSPTVRLLVRTRVWDAATGEVTAEGEVDWPPMNLFGLQRRLARDMRRGLPLGRVQAGQNMAGGSEALDPLAEESYLRALEYWHVNRGKDLERAIVFLDEAVDLEPEFAQALALRVQCRMVLTYRGRLAAADVVEESRLEAERAVSLAPDSSAAHAARGIVAHVAEWDWAKAERSYRRAIELEASHARVTGWLGGVLSIQGRDDEAIALLERARALAPEAPLWRFEHGHVLFRARRYEEAVRVYDEVLGGGPKVPAAVLARAEALIGLGREAEAFADLQRFVDRTPVASLTVALMLARTGDTQLAASVLANLGSPNRGGPPVLWARVLAHLGEEESAVNLLHRALEEHQQELVLSLRAPDLDPLREHPAFRELACQLDLPGCDGLDAEVER